MITFLLAMALMQAQGKPQTNCTPTYFTSCPVWVPTTGVAPVANPVTIYTWETYAPLGTTFAPGTKAGVLSCDEHVCRFTPNDDMKPPKEKPVPAGDRVTSGWKTCAISSAGTWCVDERRTSEPKDVPAVWSTDRGTWYQDPTISRTQCEKSGNHWAEWAGTSKGMCWIAPMTCADRKRILLHDEQSPPTYWCHKPQTGAK